MSDLRLCAKCRIPKPLSAFGTNRNSCLECVAFPKAPVVGEPTERIVTRRLDAVERRERAAIFADCLKPRIAREQKRCPRCCTVKAASEFHRDASRSDGLEPYCIACDAPRRLAKFIAKNASDPDSFRANARTFKKVVRYGLPLLAFRDRFNLDLPTVASMIDSREVITRCVKGKRLYILADVLDTDHRRKEQTK